MTTVLRRMIVFALLVALGTLNFRAESLLAEDHVVSTTDLQMELRIAAETRQANLTKVRTFFSSEPAKGVLKPARINLKKIEKAIPSLTDEELARLAVQADQVQRDFAAGALTNQQLTYIVIALATAVIVILIVSH